MSTDDDRPLTRAEARARREAEERAAVTPPPAADEPILRAESSTYPGFAADPAPAADPVGAELPAASPADADRGAGSPEPAAEAAEPPRRPRRRFALVLGGVIGVLALVAAGLGIGSLLLGPRVSAVKVDPQAAIDASGTRMTITASEPLAKIDPAQVTIEPAAPFTVDSSGRNVGIRFTVPLDDSTEYTVTVKDVTGTDGTRSGTLRTSFRTPASAVFLLQRNGDGDDTIFRTDLTGQKAVPVVQHAQIDDFRATADQLVVATEKDGLSQLLVMDRDGSNQRELTLPGPGFASTLQVSDRGDYVGYTFTDKGIGATSGRASMLVTQSLHGDGKPQIVKLGDAVPSIAEWRFVPDSTSALFIDFTGALYVDDRAGTAGPTALGFAQTIEGISRGTYTAIVSRANQLVELDLADGSEKPLPPSTPDTGSPSTIVPFPGGTLRQITLRDAAGLPTGQDVVRVGDDGKAEKIFSVTGSDAIMQVCASPSGQYTAVVVAPDLVTNTYDRSLLPLPKTLQTHLLDTRTGKGDVVLNGFDLSWCATAPRR